METFKPKLYMEGELSDSSNKCKHELLITSLHDEGMYGRTYKCLICEKSMHYGIHDNPNLSNKFIYKSFSSDDENLLISLLWYVSEAFKEKEVIDIVKIFEELVPEVEKIRTKIFRLKLEK